MIPGFLVIGLLLRQDDVATARAVVDHVDGDFVADADLRVARAQFFGRNQAFRFRADIHQRAVIVDALHGAGDNSPASEPVEASLLLQQLFHALVGRFDLPCAFRLLLSRRSFDLDSGVACVIPSCSAIASVLSNKSSCGSAHVPGEILGCVFTCPPHCGVRGRTAALRRICAHP